MCKVSVSKVVRLKVLGICMFECSCRFKNKILGNVSRLEIHLALLSGYQAFSVWLNYCSKTKARKLTRGYFGHVVRFVVTIVSVLRLAFEFFMTCGPLVSRHYSISLITEMERRENIAQIAFLDIGFSYLTEASDVGIFFAKLWVMRVIIGTN